METRAINPRAEKALNLRELANEFGYSTAQLRKMGLTHRGLPGGKMLPSVFRKYLENECAKGFIRLAKKVAVASPALTNDLRTIADTLSAPRKSNAQLVSLPRRGESLLRSTELQTSL